MGSIPGTTPELSDVIRTIVDAMLVEVNICMPAKIVSYNKATQYASVQVQLLQSYIDGSLKPFPVIPNVPVKHPRAMDGAAFIHMPLVPGDDVTLVVSQRSLDNWKTQGGMSNPDDYRMHHITDAYALIGGSAIPDAFTPTTDDAIEIVNGQAALNIFPDGNFEMMNSTAALKVFPDGKFQLTNGTNELIDLIDQLCMILESAETAGGPFLPDTITAITQIQTKIETLKGP